MTNERVAGLSVWLQAARPRTLGAAVAPVAMGLAIAWREGHFDLLSAVCTLLGALLIQIGTNYCNDYADFVKGTDTPERVGPRRATAAGLVTPEQMKRATVLVFALAAAAAVVLVVRAGWPVAVIGVLGILSGVLYTAGPRPLGYIGLGDLFTLVFFGPVAVAGTHYVQTLHFSPGAAVAGLGPGLLSVAILTVNNLRDIEQDRKAGKRTLAVRYGESFARWEYTLAVMGAGLVAFALVGLLRAPPNTAAAGLIAVAAIGPLRTVWTTRDPALLNHLLGYTGMLSLLYAALFCVGWLL